MLCESHAVPAEQAPAVYTLGPRTPRHAVVVTRRGALTALRADLEYLSLLIGPDDLWPDQHTAIVRYRTASGVDPKCFVLAPAGS